MSHDNPIRYMGHKPLTVTRVIHTVLTVAHPLSTLNLVWCIGEAVCASLQSPGRAAPRGAHTEHLVAFAWLPTRA